MNSTALTRRNFFALTSAGFTAAMLPRSLSAAEKSSPTRWPIGCFNRLGAKWSYDEALDSIKGAGYKWTGLLTPAPARGDVFTSSSATPDYLASVKQKIAARGLKANMAALRVKNDVALA